jgi:hypothetical protein
VYLFSLCVVSLLSSRFTASALVCISVETNCYNKMPEKKESTIDISSNDYMY